MLKAPFSFEGRIQRAEYIISLVVYIIGIIIVSLMSEMNSYLELFSIPFIWFSLAQSTKRCHDVGRSGWNQILPWYFFIMLFSRGDNGLNEYDKDFIKETIPDVLDSQE